MRTRSNSESELSRPASAATCRLSTSLRTSALRTLQPFRKAQVRHLSDHLYKDSSTPCTGTGEAEASA